MDIKSKALTKNEISYLHVKLRKKAGPPTYCSNPDCLRRDTAKTFEWALLKGHSYSDDPKDYHSLCSSCHRKYDETDDRRKKISETRKRRMSNIRKSENVFNQKSIIQLTKSGEFVAEWCSLSEATKHMGFKNVSSIGLCVTGRQPSAGGYLWRYKL